MDFKQLALDEEEFAIEARRHIHRHPELSGVEYETVSYIKGWLESFGIEYVDVPPGGILGFIGDESKGRTILLRADMDALPITESPCNLKFEKTVVSENPGVCHACGHDAHTAMLLASAKILKKIEKSLPGRVLLFFERGEEATNNVIYLLKHMLSSGIKVDAAHAIHMATPQSGMFMVEEGPRHAGNLTLGAVIHGKGGHGSRPDLSRNPLDAFVATYAAAPEIRISSVSPYDQLSFSICQVECGHSPNTIADDLSFLGTVRYYNEKAGRSFAEGFIKRLSAECELRGMTFEQRPLKFGLPVINNPALARMIRANIVAQFGEDRLRQPRKPSMGSETFAFVGALYPSVMIGLGCGNEELGMTSGIHTPGFDIDEATLKAGVEETVSFAYRFLNSDEALPFEPWDKPIEELWSRE
ncbi:MAG: amidohydrolase [Clostridiales bacterium]|nr:amidohydrolase [Clostridiales bacterium]